MKNSRIKTIKCWGIIYGNTINKEQTEEVTIEMRCKTIQSFKDKCKNEGHKLTSEPYQSSL